jgi:mRNA interferase MazF
MPLTSRTDRLQPGEFMKDWQAAGLNVQTAVKRGIFTIRGDLIIRKVGSVAPFDAEALEQSLRGWLQL